MSAPVIGLISWCPQLGKPLGQIQLQSPTHQQDCPMLTRKFPQDLLKVIYALTGSSILETCRSGYQLFSPFSKWVDVHALNAQAVGFFMQSNFSYSLGVVIRADTTYKARYRGLDGTDKTWEGSWDLLREISSGHIFLAPSRDFDSRFLDFPDEPSGLADLVIDSDPADLQRLVSPYSVRIRFTSPVDIPQPMGANVDVNLFITGNESGTLEHWRRINEMEVIDHLMSPEPEYHMECGVPHDLQNSETPCCLDVVRGVVESVWCNPTCQQLGDDVKEAVAKKVAIECMAPPGMSRNEIRVAIARELANHQQWKSIIQTSIVS